MVANGLEEDCITIIWFNPSGYRSKNALFSDALCAIKDRMLTAWQLDLSVSIVIQRNETLRYPGQNLHEIMVSWPQLEWHENKNFNTSSNKSWIMWSYEISIQAASFISLCCMKSYGRFGTHNYSSMQKISQPARCFSSWHKCERTYRSSERNTSTN